MSADSATGRAELTPYQAYYAVASNTVRNAIVASVGTLGLLWLSGIWSFGAKVGFWIAVVFTALEGIQVLLVTASTVVVNVIGPRRPGEGWLIAANVVQIAGEAVSVTLLLFLRFKIWG
ncbi:hypothetical protein [Myxococcus qinghaiensis]|uniref:hypothetical protein n=1 Tax=Myxococcus qinghaiensis TaxID=2906758 RepID=UPI0020A7F6DE|nr:hypothetical protein [Myxococcus qinghaiensis]MCP3167061.1 hypothetical protein [Myxococcus qinghaiensis]